jgi:hypothetical protein
MLSLRLFPSPLPSLPHLPIRLRRLPKSLNYALHNPIAAKECAMSLILWLWILVGNAAAIVVLSNMTAEGTSAMGGRS